MAEDKLAGSESEVPVGSESPVGFESEVPTKPEATEPEATEPEAKLPRHKVHHTYIWLGSIRVSISVLLAAFISLFSTFIEEISKGVDDSGIPISLIMIGVGVLCILIVGLVFLMHFLSYRHLWYELGSSEFNLYSGIFNKKRVHVPYQRVQSVDQRMSLLQRLCGVCTVHIDTAGGAHNKAVTVPYLRNTDAEWLRSELFVRKQIAMGVISEAEVSDRFSSTVGAPSTAPGAAPYPPTTSAAQAQAGFHAQASAPPPPPGSAGSPSTPGAPVPPPAASGATGIPGASTSPARAGTQNILESPAEAMREMRGVFGGEMFAPEEASYSHGLSNKELVLTGVSSGSTSLIVLLFTLIGTIGGGAPQVLALFFGEQFVEQGFDTAAQAFMGNLVFIAVGLTVLSILVIWIISIVGNCIFYGGFKARRLNSRIEVEHGLLQHRFHGVDIDRVQSVVIKQSFIRRLMGYCEISLGKIDAAATDSDGKQETGLNPQGLIVHPFVKLNRVPEILAGLVPEFSDIPQEVVKLPKVALRRAIVRYGIVFGKGFWLAVIVAVQQIVWALLLQAGVVIEGAILSYANTVSTMLYALSALCFVLDIVGAVLWYRHSSFAFNKRFMQITNGGFSNESVSFPRQKIQFGHTKTNPFQRRARVATLKARTAAGIGGTTMRIIDAREEDALRWLDWLTPGGNSKGTPEGKNAL